MLSGTSLIGGHNIHDRAENDFYATPKETTEALLNALELKGSILEPSCGMGHISKVLESYYKDSEVVSTDLIDRGYGAGNIDFLTHDFGRTFDNVITNPPFKYAVEFINKALELSTDKVIMLLKIQFLESKKRKELFKTTPLKYVYVFSDRQNPMRNGEEINPETKKPWCSTMVFAWYVWEKGYTGEPIIRWL